MSHSSFVDGSAKGEEEAGDGLCVMMMVIRPFGQLASVLTTVLGYLYSRW
jgi:hypothetical protein